MTVVIALVAGLVIGLSLGALGGGGSILAVPVLVYALGQTATQATTGSLVVVGATALVGALTAYRAGNVLLLRGLTFGLVATGGAALGAKASTHVPEPVLLASFATFIAIVAIAMAVRLIRQRKDPHQPHDNPEPAKPIIGLRPRLSCDCPRGLKVLLAATVVGLLTGFLGVGGGFLIVPALVVALNVPMKQAAGTSLVAITVTSAAALATRIGTGIRPDWSLVLLLTSAAMAGGYLGGRAVPHIRAAHLQIAFTLLLFAVAAYTAWAAVPSLA